MIIEGTRRGLGKHNAATTNPDDLVAALMVRLPCWNIRPMAVGPRSRFNSGKPLRQPFTS